MNKQQKKTAIVDNLLNIANHSEKGYKHNFHDVTFYCPGISEYVDGANGVLVKKLWSYNHIQDSSRYTYKLHFVRIEERFNRETTVVTWDKMDEITRNQVARFLNCVKDNGCAKIGSMFYFSLK